MIKPSTVDLATIRECAKRACRMQGDTLHKIEVGERYSTNEGAPDVRSINILQVDATPHWEESDLFDLVDWADFKRGIPSDDGRAMVDFYCYSRDGLSTNIQARFERGRLVWTGIDSDIAPFTHWEMPADGIDGIQVELDREMSIKPGNDSRRVQRIAPRYEQLTNWSNRTRFKIGATVHAFGKRYGAELHETNAHGLDVVLWLDGRQIQEKHLLDVRQAVRDAYAAAFGLKMTIKLGVGTIYRRAPDLIQTGVTL